jgi:ribosomal protein L11 methyltransferase
MRAEVVSEPVFRAVRFDVDGGDADRWSDALLDAGALCVDAADPRAGTHSEAARYAESDAADPQWWPLTRLTALCAAADPVALLDRCARALGIAVPAFEAFAVPDQDWVRATQAQFEPIRIADDFWIVPTWCEPPRADALNIVLDPGLAFGTGAHPTTQLCLRWLRGAVAARASVLDYGCGSGILAIAAAKLGARRVVGTDIDAQALRASIANARANRVDAAFVGVDELAHEHFDVVVANILAHPLRLLAPALAARTARGGVLGLSGILGAQAPDVIGAYAPWFDLRVEARDADWVLLAGARRACALA